VQLHLYFDRCNATTLAHQKSGVRLSVQRSGSEVAHQGLILYSKDVTTLDQRVRPLRALRTKPALNSSHKLAELRIVPMAALPPELEAHSANAALSSARYAH
jgi:hypothetical protein